MNILDLMILGLAVWRISSLFVNEKGPLDIFIKIRELAGIVHDDLGYQSIIPDGLLAGILSCVWCFSIWASFFVTVLIFVFPELWIFFLLPFSISAISIILELLVKRLNL